MAPPVRTQGSTRRENFLAPGAARTLMLGAIFRHHPVGDRGRFSLGVGQRH